VPPRRRACWAPANVNRGIEERARGVGGDTRGAFTLHIEAKAPRRLDLPRSAARQPALPVVGYDATTRFDL
jgi:hypothetical protein